MNLTEFNVVSLDRVNLLPEDSGVYVAVKDTQVLYVGKATNLKARWKNHHRSYQLKQIGGVNLYWRLYAKERILGEEERLTYELNPELNNQPVKTGTGKSRFSLAIDKELLAWLRAYAEDEHRTVGGQLEEILKKVKKSMEKSNKFVVPAYKVIDSSEYENLFYEFPYHKV